LNVLCACANEQHHLQKRLCIRFEPLLLESLHDALAIDLPLQAQRPSMRMWLHEP